MPQRNHAGDQARGTESKFYLPSMPRLQAAPGRVERYVRGLLRQRGTYRIRISRKSHTVSYNDVKIFDTPGCRNPSRDYSRQYQ
jgi:hypothetical protein